MTSHNQSQISQLEREIVNLKKDFVAETKKEADLFGRINRAEDAVSRTKNSSTRRSKIREIEQCKKALVSVKKKQVDVERRKVEKSKRLREYQSRQARDDERARKKVADEERKLMREREAHERRISSGLKRPALQTPAINSEDTSAKTYDFFISHASEDKDDFVRELAELLTAEGATVWYDEFALRVGNSLRREIDRGLANSRFGIVVLSESFFRKNWPQKELDGLVALENEEYNRILPIWHKVSKDEVTQHSPTLADRIALSTSLKSTKEIVCELMTLIRDE